MNAYYLNNNDSNLNNNHVYNYLVCDHKVHDCVHLKKKTDRDHRSGSLLRHCKSSCTLPGNNVKTMRSSLHLLQLVRGYNEQGVYILNAKGCVTASYRKHQI